jgi:hypothetical protein
LTAIRGNEGNLWGLSISPSLSLLLLFSYERERDIEGMDREPKTESGEKTSVYGDF